ncbi:PEP-CTERM sorting domain-containing protein [Lacipirellula sp.]|uniref:PEP-CTERM sorting domain-containing protein n=1 Tax=Lacipirellula sp. TaxID=2691419 RepID=UPI003D138266
MLTSATIPAGSVAELSGPWRRIQIAPLVLQPGFYSIGGQNKAQSTDDMVYIGDPPLSVVDPRVDIISFDFNINGPDGFHPPGSAPSGWYAFRGVELGPMLFVEAVPEPATASLFLIGLAFLAGRKRRKLR